MMVDSGIIETVVGAMLGWFANHFYSRRGSKELKQLNADLRADNASLRGDNGELKALVEKLPEDFRSAVANDPRATLTAEQLNEVSGTVAELHDRQEPRRISEQQRSKIVRALQAIPASAVLVSAPSNDIEAQQYSDQISAAFQQAGWPTSTHTSIAATEVSGVAVGYYCGLHVYPRRTPPPPTDEAQAVRYALGEGGISAEFLPIEEARPAEIPSSTS